MLIEGRTFRRLCRAREQLREIGGEPISVREVARGAGISPFHFIRQFEAVFGATPHRYRTEVRMERARELLARGQSVTEICLELGFSSLGSFSSAFARRVGESPSAYQRRLRVLVQVPDAIGPGSAPGCLSLLGWLPASAFAISEKRPVVVW
jgi:AraC-like DNA-binding protein